jgi:decaprenylphospho-beta-D-erythro-pentofuranosid-2-ulose 2-reductase
MKFRHAIVIGASSGIGAELVRQLAASGCKVAAVARRQDRLEALASDCGALPFVHDVRNTEEVSELFQRITQTMGGFDLMIYAAGIMPSVGEQEYDFEKDRETMMVNVLGAMVWIDQAAIRFEGTRKGSIVAIGSVAGDRGRAGQPAYNASKAALTTFMEALRNRLASKGVRVVTIKPGPTATEMTSHLRSRMMDPADVAKKILAVSDKTGEHYVKFAHWVAFAIIRNIPSAIFRKLKI